MRKPMLIAMWILSVSPAYSAILDCSRAQSKVEHLICDEKTHPELWELDLKLNKFFEQSLQQTEIKETVIKEQKKWLKTVRNVCKEAECLRRAYQARIAELQQSSTLCQAQETVVFSCTLPQKKIVSLCASQRADQYTDSMQYRMGRNATTVEMEFPKIKGTASKFYKYYSLEYPKGETHAISFWNGEYRYSLFLSESAIGYNGAGVILSRGHPPVRVSFSKCRGEVIVFDAYLKPPVVSFYRLGDRFDLPDANGDISTYGPETDANFGKNLEDEPPRPGEYEVSPH